MGFSLSSITDAVTGPVGSLLSPGSALGISAVTGEGAIPDLVNGVLGEGRDYSSGANPFSIEGLGGSASFDPTTGKLSTTADPRLAGLFSQGLGQATSFGGMVPGAGKDLLGASSGFLSEAMQFDPFAAAEEQFNRLDAILEPGRTSARSGTAAGLLSTGRLGGTSGNEAQAAVEAAIERERQGLLSSQFTNAQGVLDSLVNRATGLRQAGIAEKGAYQGLQQGALNNALGIDSQLLSLLNIGSGVTKTAADPGQESGFQSLVGGALEGGIGALVSMI